MLYRTQESGFNRAPAYVILRESRSEAAAAREEGMVVVKMITRQGLLEIRSKALRTRIWFRTLSKVERTIVNLTIRCVEEIHSYVLAKTISDIIRKILAFLPKRFVSEAQKVGREIAEALCIAGEKWHNSQAAYWKHDIQFHRFLGVNKLNEAGWFDQ